MSTLHEAYFFRSFSTLWHTGMYKISAISAILCFSTMLKAKKKQGYEAFLIGKQIRYYRRIKEMSQRQLAYKVGVSLGWIGRIERGMYLPNIKLLFKISGALQVQVKDPCPARVFRHG
jgi:DNA-binding XRE family transcriptional regulator